MANHSLSRFQKRHYEAIALAMQEARRRANGSNDPIAVVVDELADVFTGGNGQFKRERFIRACDPGANVRARS
jgi:methyl coenzyme M reductase alpha subunit